jgi:hypothetical protein
MPSGEALLPDVRLLAKLQAYHFIEQDWSHNLEQLTTALEQVAGKSPSIAAAQRKRIVQVLFSAALVAVVLTWAWPKPKPKPLPVAEPQRLTREESALLGSWRLRDTGEVVREGVVEFGRDFKFTAKLNDNSPLTGSGAWQYNAAQDALKLTGAWGGVHPPFQCFLRKKEPLDAYTGQCASDESGTSWQWDLSMRAPPAPSLGRSDSN